MDTIDTTENQCSRDVASKLIKWTVDKRGMPVIFGGSLDSLKSIANDLSIPMHDARILVSDKPERIADHSILFLEEQNADSAKEQAKLYKLMLDRETGGYRLPENVSVVVIRNESGQHRMPKAFSSKCFHVVLRDDNKTG
jgi:hypothetical protein